MAKMEPAVVFKGGTNHLGGVPGSSSERGKKAKRMGRKKKGGK